MHVFNSLYSEGILVFLTGQEEIESVVKSIRDISKDLSSGNCMLLTFHLIRASALNLNPAYATASQCWYCLMIYFTVIENNIIGANRLLYLKHYFNFKGRLILWMFFEWIPIECWNQAQQKVTAMSCNTPICK